MGGLEDGQYAIRSTVVWCKLASPYEVLTAQWKSRVVEQWGPPFMTVAQPRLPKCGGVHNQMSSGIRTSSAF
jgi:hypothetical protein